MKAILSLIMAVTAFIPAYASSYDYTFDNTPVADALVTISKEHPDINISFIYTELDNYLTSARISTDSPLEALRQAIGSNPVSVLKKGNGFYIEALQHGKFIYRGQTIDSKGEPVISATVMLLEPNDSTVITYGVTDKSGRFSIPCDRKDVIAKIKCLGYIPAYRHCKSFAVGIIEMKEASILLSTVSVETANSVMLADRSVYLPTSRQKRSAQTADDLIRRMAIPQLSINDVTKTNTGRPVKLYIDYVPATEAELTGMRVADVKRVEYYDYPSDPRFEGNDHVINFIMHQYEYGGYTKGIYYDNFVTSRQFNGYAKVQYKNMTFDWAGGLFNKNDSRSYQETSEIYRLPQNDGLIKEFERNSEVSEVRNRQDICWTSVKAMYRTKNTVMSNMLTADFDHSPRQFLAGNVTYNPEEYKSSEFTSSKSHRINSIIYSGYWYFKLPGGSSVTLNQYYAYSHTNQHSLYDEIDLGSFDNGARDDSHQANVSLAFTHSFGSAGTLKALCQGRFLQNRTRYQGTSTVSDLARTYRLGPGVNYSFTNDRFYANAGLGLHWDKSSYGSVSENSTAPWANLSLQYSADSKNSLSLDVDYRKSIPASSYRSASVIQANPFMSYTGNPALVPYNSFQIDGSYVFVPNNRLSLSAYGWAWIVDNRYAFCYEAGPTGILRTIRQPMGGYAQWQYGIKATTRQFNNNLQVSASVYMRQAHNGIPYNWNKSDLTASVSAYYYLNNVYFGASYNCAEDYPDGCMVGEWIHARDRYSFEVGWSDNSWNFRFFTRNFLRRKSYDNVGTMQSKYYDTTSYYYRASSYNFFQISATYTFAFGKRIKDGNEAYQASRASSGILK